MFAAGILLCFLLFYSLSLYIWNIHIEGNQKETTEGILDYLETEKVVHGMRKSQVDCKGIQESIRIRFPDIIWVSAQVRGTRLLIHIRENEDELPTEEILEKEPRDLVAAKEGIITSVLVRRGISGVQVGDTVEEGARLVSGRLDLVGDNGEVIGYQYTSADADIYARTVYTYHNVFLLSHEEKHKTGKKRRGAFLKIGKYHFRLDPGAGKMQAVTLCTEYPLRLTENFYLPLLLGTALHEEYEVYTTSYGKEEARRLAEDELNKFLENLMQKGVQIVENHVKIEVGRNTCVSSGTIVCLEEIGKGAPTEILEAPDPAQEEQP